MSLQKAFSLTGAESALISLEKLLASRDIDWELWKDILVSLQTVKQAEDTSELVERQALLLIQVQDYVVQNLLSLSPDHLSLHLLCEILALAATIPLTLDAQNVSNWERGYFRYESLCYGAIQAHVASLLTATTSEIATGLGLSTFYSFESSTLDVFSAIVLFQALREQLVRTLPTLSSSQPASYYINEMADVDYQLLCRMVLTNQEQLVSNALLRMLPCILKRSHATEEFLQTLILTLWKILGTQATSSEETPPLVALIMLANYIFPDPEPGARKCITPVIESVSSLASTWLWHLLQRGLADTNGLTRKRCQYLLKRAVDWWGQCGTFHTNEIVCLTYLGDVREWPQCSTLWNDVFLLLETCEEKQVHLVKPVLSRLDALLRAAAPATGASLTTPVQQEKEVACLGSDSTTSNTKSMLLPTQSPSQSVKRREVATSPSLSFHFGWLLVILRRLMMHDNLQVSRWAVRKILTLELRQCPYLFYPDVDFLFRYLIPAFNNLQLYYNNRDLREEVENGSSSPPSPSSGSKGTTARLMSTFFASLPSNVPAVYRDLFFHRLLCAVMQPPWNAVALCHVTDALTAIPSVPVWHADHLQLLQRFLSRALQAHEPLLRAAVQCYALTTVCHLTAITSPEDLETLEAFCLFVGSLRRTECLDKAWPQYKQLCTWLQRYGSRETLFDLIQDWLRRLQGEQSFSNETRQALTDPRPVCRTLIAWLDATDTFSLEELALVEEWLEPVLSYVKDSAHRSYVAVDRVDLALHVLRSMLEEMEGSPAAPNLRVVLMPYLRDGLEFLVTRLPELTSLSHYEVMEQYFEFLDTVAKHVPDLGRTMESHLCAVGQGLLLRSGSSSMAQVAGMALLAFWSGWAKHSETWEILAAEMIQTGRLNHRLKRDIQDGNLSRNVQTQWGGMVSRYYGHLWKFLGPYATSAKLDSATQAGGGQDGEDGRLLEIVEAAVEALTMVGMSKESIAPILSALQHLLPRVVLAHPSVAVAAVEKSWELCLEYRRAEPFWHVAQGFVSMAIQLPLLREPAFCQKIYEFLARMRDSGEAIVGFYNLGVERLCGLWLEAAEFPVGMESANFVADALTFGILRRRDESIFYETFAYIAACRNDLAANAHLTSAHDADLHVRFRAVQVLLALSPTVEAHVIWANQICRVLIERDSELAKHKFNFCNSYIHRVKQRLWQALLLLHPLYHEETGGQVLERVLENLVAENPQPSVRFLQEWVVTRLGRRHPHLLTRFWDAMQTAVEQRTGCVVSFIAIATHIARATNEESEASRLLMDQCLQRILPWAMAQHFTPRVYAMMSLTFLWTYCEAREFSELLERYGPVKHLLEQVPEQANFARNLLKLREDFYFKVFHHELHYTLETVYWELPRLTHVAEDEWIPPQWFKEDSHTHVQLIGIPLYNPSSDLRTCKPAEWVVKASGAGGSSLDEPSDETGTETGLIPSIGNVQKKVTPWKNMLPDLENLAMFQPAIAARKKEITDGLVVVASLIDRLPNLGGLCRTCEVFGVKEMVLASLKYAEDKQFTTLSVSAERWIPLKEVKVPGLPEYLEYMKKEGYTIIGAEQTANSVSLSEYRFPKKSLLLLGSEKEGVPVELIQQLDVCVEVPQYGLIRSMNVHVTGAVFIWEYRRQQGLTCT